MSIALLTSTLDLLDLLDLLGLREIRDPGDSRGRKESLESLIFVDRLEWLDQQELQAQREGSPPLQGSRVRRGQLD